MINWNTSQIRGCVCSTGPFQFRWLKGYIHCSCYYHHQIGSINLTLSYHIFPWLCAWDVCYIIFCHLLHIHSGKTGFFVQFMMSANSRIRFDLLVVFVCLYITPSYYHYCANLSEDMRVRYILSSAWVRLSIFSQLSIIQYMGLCVFSLPPFPWDDGETIHFVLLSSSNRKYEPSSIGDETMVCAVCLSIFLHT